MDTSRLRAAKTFSKVGVGMQALDSYDGARVAEWRRHLHSIPEPGFAEVKTSAFVAARLKEMGMEVHSGVGQTGVVGVLRRGCGNRAIGLRADMDALRIREQTGLPHRSIHDGYMHACGHDGHTAMLLGAAWQLATEGGFSGTVVLIFQPNEEHGRGASAMVHDGLFERFPVEEIYGIHNAPGLPLGHLATRSGPINAAEDNFVIKVNGKGGHAARPQSANDPMVVAANIILSLQTIVSRRVSAKENAVLSVTEVIADGTRNVLADSVEIRGDARSYTREVQDLIERQMRQISQGIAQAFGATVDVQYSHEFAPTINHQMQTAFALNAAATAFGAASVSDDYGPNMGSEDFGLFLSHRPGNFAYLGNGAEGPCGEPLHNPRYDFNDKAIEHGVSYWTTLVRQRLG